MNAENRGIIAISGASGFIGSHLSRTLETEGWTVVPLSRQAVIGNPLSLAKCLKGARAVINLAGAPILSRWTPSYKKILVESRTMATHHLVEAMASLSEKPKVFISTSAVGYYAEGRRQTEEDHDQADGFLGRLTREWEQEAWGANDLCIRTIIFRLGVVLGAGGGALKQMLPAFHFGAGGTIGSGTQAFSWIHLNDLIRAYLAALTNPNWEGVYNLTAPEPTTNAGLTRALGEALTRPTRLSVPQFILKLRFGEGATVLTHGQEVIPKRLLDAGFQFTYNTIDEAIRQCVADLSSA